jgi:hypothetical protein
VEAELADEGIEARTSAVERWLEDEERWTGEAPSQSWEEEEVARGRAPWQVRVERKSHAQTRELADDLERQGYNVVRRFRYVIVGASSEVEARDLALRLRGKAEAGGEVVWEGMPQSLFGVFFGLIAIGWAVWVLGVVFYGLCAGLQSNPGISSPGHPCRTLGLGVLGGFFFLLVASVVALNSSSRHRR